MPVRQWIVAALAGGGAVEVALRLAIALEPREGVREPAIILASQPDKEIILDIVDAILQLGGPWPQWSEAELLLGRADSYQQAPRRKRWLAQLQHVLELGESAYRVSERDDRLITIDDPTATAALATAVAAASGKSDAGSAAAHLQAAWDAMHRLHPDPPTAYSQAIKAVEAAAHAVIQPNRATATLGTMLGELRNTSHLYRTAIPGEDGKGNISVVVAMATMLWEGQTSRHGGMTPTRDETLDEARMAVGLAVTLTQWFTTDAISRIRPHRR